MSMAFLQRRRWMSEDPRNYIFYRLMSFYYQTPQMFYDWLNRSIFQLARPVIQYRLRSRDVAADTWDGEETLFPNWRGADAAAVLRATHRAASSRRGINNDSTAVTDSVCLSAGFRTEGEKPQRSFSKICRWWRFSLWFDSRSFIFHFYWHCYLFVISTVIAAR